MKRVNLFLILLITAAVSLIAATVIGFAVFASQTSQNDPYYWMSQMWGGSGSYNGYGGMGGMMGQTPTPTPATNTLLPMFGAAFAVLIAIAVVGVIGISYYLVYPQIRTGTAAIEAPQANASANGSDPYESIAKTLTDDERKVIDSLKAHDGEYLQKYIKAETGLSRLQTHRILARLSERGIVSLEKTGNTNQVKLADWLSKQQ